MQQNLRRIIRQFLNRTGYDIQRFIATNGSHLDLLDLVVRLYLKQKEDLFFLQIGANDGITDDPLKELIREFGLKGLLVEPVPIFFHELVRNYVDQPQLEFENCAISEENGKIILYKFKYPERIYSKAKGVVSLNRKHLLRLRRFFKNRNLEIEEIEVPSMTLKNLLIKHDVGKVDLLQVDTEGYDYEILKFAFKTRLRPHIINYEYYHLSPKDQVDCRRLLADNGYRLANIDLNTLAIKKDWLE